MKKRKYVQVDLNTGNILAFDIKPVKEADKLLQDNWLSIDDESYELLLLNQGQIIIDVPALVRFLQNNKVGINENVITKQFLIIEHSLQKAKLSKKEKNNWYCSLYVDYGISYNNIIYPFTLKDRLRYVEQSLRKDNNKYINSENGIVKVSKEDFNIIYNKQFENQRKWEVYTSVYNEFIDTLTSYEQISNLGYEVDLPDIYKEKINNELNIAEDKEDIFDVIINELSHLDDNNKEVIYKKLQDIDFSIKELYKNNEDNTTITEEVNDVKEIIDESNKKLVEEMDVKYKEETNNNSEVWSKELEDKLTSIGQNKVNKDNHKGVLRISAPELSKVEKEAISELQEHSLVDGVDYNTVKNTSKNIHDKYKELLRENIVIENISDPELDEMMQDADTITNSEIDELIEGLDNE